MMRSQLNAQHYQQAVRFAENFAKAEKDAFLAETHHRHRFEKAQLERSDLQILPRKRPLVIGIFALLAVCVASSLFYWQTGRYTEVMQGEQAHSRFLMQRADENNAQRNDHYIVNLQNQLRENANNGQLWFELGQAYTLNNDFMAAMVCYDNALKLLGRKAAIIGAMATAEYYRDKQKLSPQTQSWIKEALQLDPNESASLLLLASDAFLNNNPKQAITYWEKVLDSENQAIDRREIIQSIKVAEQLVEAQK